MGLLSFIKSKTKQFVDEVKHLGSGLAKDVGMVEGKVENAAKTVYNDVKEVVMLPSKTINNLLSSPNTLILGGAALVAAAVILPRVLK